MKTLFIIVLAAGMTLSSAQTGSIQPVPFKVQAGWPDPAEALSPADIHLEGWLGNRVGLNETNRLVKVDLEPLLAGFRQKPGSHPWIGEHIGKWMHASTLAWANTGDRALLKPVLNAWQDVVSKRLYLTGAASQGEHFRDDYYLPNHMGAHVGEQCVTTTWIQLNWQLLRLTGETRFGDQLEQLFYNQLAAAQRPDGAQWCYFTAPQGTKPYGPGINCCVSSGPRGMALVPRAAALRMPARAERP